MNASIPVILSSEHGTNGTGSTAKGITLSCEHGANGAGPVTKSVALSCEFFPTVSEDGARKLDGVRRQLAEALPLSYCSVTYGAGGSTRERTLNTVQRMLADGQVVMPHLTCVGASREDIAGLLDHYRSLGINRLMALRGDMPSGMYQPGDWHDARDLVAYARASWGPDARIFVAAYPECHPRARSPAADVDFFCAKVKAGANEAITQYFFNGDAYLRFRDEVAARGVDITITPGIMPITNYSQLARFSDSCGAEIPRWLRKRLESLQDQPEALLDFGADVIAQLCQRLIAEGVPALHFYSMNRADVILSIADRLGWRRG